ncbi:MAG: ATP-binding protein [Bacteroidales bacterium]|nr:ATP-binding protein [Bacteroidales bacterium]
MNNPFITNGYSEPRYFCDRLRETEMLTRLLTNGNNVALISPRRLGKTDLLHHCFTQPEIQEHYYTFIIDIYATTSMRDFINVFGKSVLDELKSKGKRAWNLFLQTLSSLRSEITYDGAGLPTWSMSIGAISNPSVSLDEIFSYLNHADKPCLVAFDEFQQITRYPDAANVEAALRTYIQRCNNAHFVFSGSQRHLMGAIFTSPSRPFYQSVSIINLPPIPLEKYTDFVVEKFEEAGKHIEKEVVEDIYERFQGITSYMQRIMNLLFTYTPVGATCKMQMVDPCINELIDFSSDTYESLLYQMPEKQREVFLAIAKESDVKNISGSTFVRKHSLVSASSVLSAVKGLLEKDFITQDKNVYSVYDKFFTLWLKRKNIL